MAPATILPATDIQDVARLIQSATKYTLQAPSIVLAVDNSSTESAASKGLRGFKATVVTASPPRIDSGADPVFYNGQDPNVLLSQILKMMSAIQEVQQAIVQSMADNSKNQQLTADEYLQAVIVEGAAAVEKMKEEVKKAEDAQKNSHLGWIIGALVGALCVLATLATFGAGAALFALAFAVMMALPPDKNPLEMGSKALADKIGHGVLGEVIGKVIMMVVVAAATLVTAGAAGFMYAGYVGAQAGAAAAEEGADEAAQAAAREAAESAAKQAAAASARGTAVDAGIQTMVMLNPLSDAFQALAKATGHENDWVGTLLQAVSTLLTIILAIAAHKGLGPNPEEAGLSLLSRKAATKISAAARILALAAGITSSGFNIAAGVAKLDQADLQEEQGTIQRVYTTLQALIKMLQSSIQQNGKQQQATMQSFQTMAGNFANLAAPFKYMADASEVLA